MKKKQKLEFSKKLIKDIRALLWIVTLGGLLLAAMCIYKGYIGSLPWLSAMVGLPWTAHGTVCAFYLNMSKSDHKVGGITYETAKANNFRPYTQQTSQAHFISNKNSPQI
jgi:hypothetical protein